MINSFDDYLRELSSEINILSSLFRECNFKISCKYKYHINYFIFVFLATILLLLPILGIIERAEIHNIEYFTLLIGFVVTAIYYIICIDVFLKIKTLQDEAKNKTYNDMPESIKTESLIRFAINNNRIDAEKILMDNIEQDISQIGKKIREESMKVINSISMNDKEKAFVYFLEEHLESVRKSVAYINITFVFGIAIYIVLFSGWFRTSF